MSLIIMKGEIYQPDALIHSIIVDYFRPSDCIVLVFLYFSECVIIKKAMIIFIMKPILLKL